MNNRPTSVPATLVGSIGLIITGLGFYFGTGTSSVTALIPAFLGIPLLVCGIVALNPGALKIAMHIASVFALVGALGSSRVFMKWADLSQAARSAQLITLLICGALFVIYIGSFIKARKKADA